VHFEGLDKLNSKNCTTELEHRYENVLILIEILLENRAKKKKKDVFLHLFLKLFIPHSYIGTISVELE
jgi:hypothetical protein